jgi:hypothetical protein
MILRRTMADYYKEQGLPPPPAGNKKPAKYSKALKRLLRVRSGAKARNQLLDVRTGTRLRKVSGGALELGKRR